MTTLCPQCLAASIIAPANGPTCAHTRGTDWWPKDWATWTEAQRVKWIEQREKNN